jgi:hypothetical protein
MLAEEIRARESRYGRGFCVWLETEKIGSALQLPAQTVAEEGLL